MSKNPSQVIRIISTSIVVFFSWAAFAPLDEIVRGTGQVAPAMKNQIVQNLEGGIIKSIFVAEGDIVRAGQRLVKMDETQFQSSFQELQEQRLALLMQLERLSAEQKKLSEFVPSAELKRLAPQMAESEIAYFSARQTELSSKLNSLKSSMMLKRREVEMLAPMVAKSAVPEIELVRAKQDLVEAESRYFITQNEFETSRSQEFSDALAQLRQAEEKIRAHQDKLTRTDVLSPVEGIVNKVLATTIGGVVRPGDHLVEILPLGKKLRVEGRIAPRDIGFVFVGMPATIKLTAFDYSVYGTLSGRLVHVGADTVVDKDQQESKPYYEIYVELEEVVLESTAGDVEIRPGMQAEIELESGKKTVLEYLLKPLLKATDAFRER